MLLALVVTAGVLADEVLGHLIAEPVPGARDDAHVLGQQTHFLVEFAEHRLLWRLTMLDAALRELPGMGADAFAPKYLVPMVEQDDADVGPEAFTVEHNQLRIFNWFHYCTAEPKRLGRLSRPQLSGALFFRHESLSVLHLHPERSPG
jgi:hypothetical protein